MASYHCCSRPADVAHGHPYLVFDCQGELHLPLIVFAKEAHSRLAPSSVKKYLTGILPWFSWLETDVWQVRAGRRWDDPPEAIRGAVREYLVSQLQCRAKPCKDDGEWLETTEEATNRVRILLSGLKLFYRIAKARGYYPYANPLVGPFADPVEVAQAQLAQDGDPPRMPDISGVDVPRRTGRLTDSYFLLKDEWIPQVVTDTSLPQKILAGGRMLKQQGKAWGLREECLVRLLFETGARVSEIMSLTLGDWESRGLKDTAWARNKGSRRWRAKFVRFSEETVKLLTRYFDTERKAIDPHGYSLDDYLHLAQRGAMDLNTVPLFLSKRGTPWTAASFRANYWKKACAQARLDVDIHQARHWYVTQALAVIHEDARRGKNTVERGLEELISYMHWRSGEQVFRAYNHFYQPTHHATTQNSIFKKLRRHSRQNTQKRVPRKKNRPSTQPSPASQTLAQGKERRQDGAALYEFLIGTGGYHGKSLLTD